MHYFLFKEKVFQVILAVPADQEYFKIRVDFEGLR